MQKRTLFFVVALLGLLTVVASGKFGQLTSQMGMGGFGGTATLYDTAVSEKMMVDDAVGTRMMPPVYPGVDGALGEPDRAIEYSSSHQLVVEDVQAYMQDIKAYVQSVGGQVLYWNQGKESLQLYRYGSLTAKVPVSSFDAALSKVTEGVEDIISENQNMADITGEKKYNTQEVERIKGEIAVQEAALAEATTESAKIRIQNQLTQLRRQLADAERGSEQVAERTEYATLSISVSDSERYFGGRYQPSPTEDLREALLSVWTSIGSVLRLVIWAGVYGVIWLPVVWVGKSVWGKLAKK